MNKVNVFGSFTQALFFSGTIGIPKFLLDHYTELKITNEEIVLILHVINNSKSSFVDLSQKMNLSESHIEQMINHLKSLKLINIENNWDPEAQTNIQTYNLLGLIEELADLWAIKRVKEIEADKINYNGSKKEDKNKALYLVSLFEQEVGRPLTVLECEQIERWLISHYSEELIVEALRRGVSAGVRNFRYIDSILREWEKKGFKSRTEIEADDINFQTRQGKKIKTQDSLKKKDYEKYKNIYL